MYFVAFLERHLAALDGLRIKAENHLNRESLFNS
jgi:hypothetical protein